MKKVAFFTLGCKLNFSETSTIARQFESGGFERAERGEPADICVINTCSVTADADKKCRNVIRKTAKDNPGAIIAVTGCYVQLRPDDIAAIEGVDIVVGNNDKGALYDQVLRSIGGSDQIVSTCDAEQITSFFAAFSSGDRTRAFLKVQDGCNYQCSYCTIPEARGVSRNIAVDEIVAEARKVAEAGHKEIIITGVNIGDFGRTTGETFYDLLRALEHVEGIERYRISSIEPNLLTDEIIDFTAHSAKFMPHFHIPLQAGTDKILALMRRRYTTAKFAERIAKVKAAMPDAFIGIDVIVGFPGETAADFDEAYDFLAALEPAFLHIFPYSVRPNTPAADFGGQVSRDEKAARVHRLGELSDKLHADLCRQNIGSIRPVLLESTMKGGLMCGFTDNYIKVQMPYKRELVGQIVDVKLIGLAENGNVEGLLC